MALGILKKKKRNQIKATSVSKREAFSDSGRQIPLIKAQSDLPASSPRKLRHTSEMAGLYRIIMSRNRDALRYISTFIPGAGKGDNQGGSHYLLSKEQWGSLSPHSFCAEAELSVKQAIHSWTL